MDVTLEVLKGGVEGVTIGQIVPAGPIDGSIDNESNWVFVTGYIGVGKCLGGEVIGVLDAYEMSLRTHDVDPEPSECLRRGLSNKMKRERPHGDG